MKYNNYLLLLLVLSGIWGCAGPSDNATGNSITLVNNSELNRPDESVVIPRKKLEELTGEVPEDRIPKLTGQDGNVVVSQTDDLDQDGRWDELVVLHDFAPDSRVTLAVEYVAPSAMPQFQMRTNVRFGQKQPDGTYKELREETRPEDHTRENPTGNYQMEGPAWENDLIAFRTYFDKRNGFDIFGKTTEAMVMDSVGINENYHELQAWGMDVLIVGPSLGAGALALFEDGELIRFGETGEAHYELITEGPIRSILRLTYNDWQVNGQNLDLVRDISIYAGQNGYHNEVTLKGFTGEKTLVSGMVTIESDSNYFFDHNAEYVSLATHAVQSDNQDYLGMGLMIPKAIFQGRAEAPESGPGVAQTYYGKMKITPDQSVHFMFLSGWEEQDPQFAEPEYFKQVLQQRADRMENEIELGVPAD